MLVDRQLCQWLAIPLLLLLGSCGGGGSDSEPNGAHDLPPASVRISFAAATGTNSLTVQWEGQESGADYEVHISQDPSFTPSAATLHNVVRGLGVANVAGLPAATQFTFKVVGYRRSSIRTLSANAATVSTMGVPLVLKPGAVLNSDDQLNLTTVAITDSSVTLLTNPSSKRPRPGTYIAGIVTASNTPYLRLVVSVNDVGSPLVVATKDVDLAELFVSGKLEYTIPFPKEAIKGGFGILPNSNRRHALAVGDKACAVGQKFSNAALPTLKSYTSAPDFKVSLDLNADNPKLEASLIGDFAASLSIDWKFTEAFSVECSLRLAEAQGPTFKFLVGVIPVWVSALFAVDIKTSGSGSGPVDIALESNTSTNVAGQVRIDAVNGVSYSGTAGNLNTSVVPAVRSLNGKAMVALKGETRFLAEGKLYNIPLVKLGVSYGPKVAAEIVETEDFIKKIQPFQLQQLTIDTPAAVFAQIGLGGTIAKYLKVNGSYEVERVIASQPVFKLPDLKLNYDASGTSILLAGQSSGEIGTAIDTSTVEWPHDPSSIQVTRTSATTASIEKASQSCLKVAFSAKDKVLGISDWSRRYSKIEKANSNYHDLLSGSVLMGPKEIKKDNLLVKYSLSEYYDPRVFGPNQWATSTLTLESANACPFDILSVTIGPVFNAFAYTGLLEYHYTIDVNVVVSSWSNVDGNLVKNSDQIFIYPSNLPPRIVHVPLRINAIGVTKITIAVSADNTPIPVVVYRIPSYAIFSQVIVR